jgi:hypothetical protein
MAAVFNYVLPVEETHWKKEVMPLHGIPLYR